MPIKTAIVSRTGSSHTIEIWFGCNVCGIGISDLENRPNQVEIKKKILSTYSDI